MQISLAPLLFVIDCAQHTVRYWNGSQILLIYSRSRYYPNGRRPAFDATATSSRSQALAEELAAAKTRLESREAELQSAARLETGLQSDLQYWRTKTASLENQLQQQASSEANLRSATRRLTDDLTRLRAAQKSAGLGRRQASGTSVRRRRHPCRVGIRGPRHQHRRHARPVAAEEGVKDGSAAGGLGPDGTQATDQA